ncbi:Uncharacterized conserved protein YndB, AHSA1/START domain [Microbacterium sp. cf046]|uniref:SRPBCC domain-containing protein n=1 Tax=Microbacterium sp. cf046 TaxID=1761803 RepID=UPI0008E5B5F7|nr:SRPBCC domain-containing protein [Microbacterium sp. cf046]SFR91368.1 Uncharacterized conserved protein YndB, AHSA1/START domain [Microbacterium sp. cf046]
MRVDSAQRRISVPREVVFRAFTDPGRLGSWLPPRGMSGRLEDADLRAGGGFRMVLTYESDQARGKTTEHTDVTVVRIVALEQPSRVVWEVEFESDDPAFAGTMFMEWTLDAVSEATEITVEARDVPAGIAPEDHVAGLTSSLAQLAGLFEGGAGRSLADPGI